jgi:hypothetical protein
MKHVSTPRTIRLLAHRRGPLDSSFLITSLSGIF